MKIIGSTGGIHYYRNSASTMLRNQIEITRPDGSTYLDSVFINYGFSIWRPSDAYMEKVCEVKTPLHQGKAGFMKEREVTHVSLHGDLYLTWNGCRQVGEIRGYTRDWRYTISPESLWTPTNDLVGYKGFFLREPPDGGTFEGEIDISETVDYMKLLIKVQEITWMPIAQNYSCSWSVFAQKKDGSTSQVFSDRGSMTRGSLDITSDLLSLPNHVILSDKELENALYCAFQGLRHPDWVKDDLVQAAVQNCQKLDNNMIMYTIELAQMHKMAQAFASAAEVFANPTLNGLSSVYLSQKYGLSLTVKDTLEIQDALRQEKPQWDGYSRTMARTTYKIDRSFPTYFCSGPITATKTLKIWYSPLDHTLLNVYRGLADWDFAPTLGNVWDMVPYSFVVDWFVPLGDVLNQIDAGTYLSTLDILCAVWGTKLQTKIDATKLFPLTFARSSLMALNPTELVYYRRELSDSVPPPTLHLELPSSFNQWGAAGALIFQRTKF